MKGERVSVAWTGGMPVLLCAAGRGGGGDDFRFLGGRPRFLGSEAGGFASAEEGSSIVGLASGFRFGCWSFSNAFI